MGVAMSGCAQGGLERSLSSEGLAGSQIRIAEGVVGTVTLPDGSPLMGAMIVPRSMDDAGPAIPEIAILSDRHGNYVWPLRAGVYELTVSADGYRTATRVIKVDAEKIVELDFLLRVDD